MRKYSCLAHNSPSKVNCPQCKWSKTQNPLTDREVLAQRLAIFLGANDVQNYVSEKGYRMKIVTIVQPATLAKEEAA